MSPQTARRKYGSVEDPTKSRRGISPSSASGVDADAAERVSFDFDPSRALRGESAHDEGGGKRWFTLVVVGVLAVGAMMALTHAGYRLPKITRTSDGSGSHGEAPSLIRAHGAIPTGEDLAVDEKEQHLRPFPIIAASAPAAAEDDTHAVKDGQHQQLSGKETSPLSFEATNFYHLRDGKPALDYPWLKGVKLIEPHRETTLTVQSPRDAYEYRWQVFAGSSAEGDLYAEATGSEVTVTLTTLDDNDVVLEEVNADGTVVRRLRERVMVKYVRREIRTLTDEDREELFDAMFTLWSVRVDGGNGREIYGDDYADIFAINRLHYKGASPLECDHFHDGLGFLTNHAVISNTFEASLQKVNPKLTLPYWDFTIETSTAGSTGEEANQPQTYTEIFQESWFGTVDASDNQVKDGRWAYTEIPKMKVNNPGAVEPDVYSKLRAPWNVNDRPYLTRGMGKMCGAKVDEWYPWPTCEMHYSLATSFSDFYSWVWYSLYDPHGPVHIWIGGVLDCEETYASIADLVGPSIAEDLALYSFIHRKNLFRDGIFSCSGSAPVAEAPEELLSSGQCGCKGYDLSQGDDYEYIYNKIVDLADLIGDFDTDVKRKVVAALCTTPMNDGDHLQASSSLDPSFYATHPTMERLWMYAVLTGQIKDFSWPDEDITVTKPDGTMESESLSLYGDTCEGHAGSDVFPFGLLDSDTDGFEVKTGVKGMESGNTLTNRELLQTFDARSNSLSYVYDTFKWTHCESDGYRFDDAWDGAAEARPPSTSRRPSFKQGAPRAPMFNVLEEKRAARAAKKADNLID